MPLLMCPNDNVPMQEITRNGVQIDMCPQCRGVWLDRGELEKLMALTEPEARDGHRDQGYQDQNYRDQGRRDNDRDDDYRRRKRKHSLFDFFD